MRIIFLILTVLSALYGARSTFAAAPTISNTPSTINLDTAFSMSLTMSGLSSNTIYRLRVALAELGTSNYFGSTFNGSSWYNGTPSPINYSNFLLVTTDGSGVWSGTLQGKVESSDPNFSGSSGIYDLKVGRYTATGTSATWSNIVQPTIITPSPTPSLSPSPSSNPSPPSSSSSQSSSSSFTISNVPSSIDSTEVFSVSVNLSLPNSPNTTFYLKGAFKEKDGTNYFGLTKVSGSWIKNNKTYSDQYKITTDGSGVWSGNLEIQPDILDSGYEGSGDYIFKVGRYTEGGSLIWSNEVSIKINAQEVVLEEKEKEVLGAKVNQSKDSKPKSSKVEEYSLEKYIKVASPASIAAAPIPQAEVKGERKTNYLSWIGGFMVISGIGVFAYVYLRNRSLREAIFNLFRKRD